jgi:ammonia channel protein AmtB
MTTFQMVAVDDPLDAVAVHFGGGLWGLIAASLFDNNGLLSDASYESAMVRILGALQQRHWKESEAVAVKLFTVVETFHQ